MNNGISLQNGYYRTQVFADRNSDGVCYVAYHPDLDGCMAQGNTVAEALDSLKEAKRDYIEFALDAGFSIPESEQISVPTIRYSTPMTSLRVHQLEEMISR